MLWQNEAVDLTITDPIAALERLRSEAWRRGLSFGATLVLAHVPLSGLIAVVIREFQLAGTPGGAGITAGSHSVGYHIHAKVYGELFAQLQIADAPFSSNHLWSSDRDRVFACPGRGNDVTNV